MVGRFTGFALALVLLLAGCSDEARPDDAPTLRSPTSSPSPSPTSSADLAALARQAVLDYYAEATRAAATGDVGQLKTLSLESCPCRRLIGYIEDKWKAGSLRGARFTVRRIEILEAAAPTALVLIDHATTAYEVLDSKGHVTERLPARSGEAVVRLTLSSGRYLVIEVGGQR